MTEKRFAYYEHKGADYILDTPNKSLDFIEMLGDCLDAEEIVDLLNKQHETITYLKEVSDSKDNEISELGKQRNYLANENKTLKLKIKMLEQVKPIKELPKSIDVVIKNE